MKKAKINCLLVLSTFLLTSLLTSCNKNENVQKPNPPLSEENDGINNDKEEIIPGEIIRPIRPNDENENKDDIIHPNDENDNEHEEEIIPGETIKPIPPKEPDIDNSTSNKFDIKYDPFYPSQFQDTPYILEVPNMDERFCLNDDKTVATLFAPGVSLSGGYYDVNKNFYNDNRLCWGAASSNIIAWYLDRCEEAGINLDGIDRDVNLIFNKFRQNWDYTEGYDYLQGLAWYFTGKTLSGSTPDELKNKDSGGYLNRLPHVSDTWSILDPANHYPIVGNFQEQYPFLDANNNIDTTYEEFSKNIIGQIHYGPSAIMILPKGASSLGSHAITLWGCDYETTTGLIKAIYVTDSDDEAEFGGQYLRRVKIKRESGDHAISMIDYWPTRGNPSPFLYITDSTNIFAPTVVKKR